MSYFIFRGLNSRNYGILENPVVPPRAETGFKTVEIPGRAEPLNQMQVSRKNQTITLILGIKSIDKINEINDWLSGYGTLVLSNDLTKYYKAYAYTSINPERISRRLAKIPVTFTVMPFRYSVDNPFVSYSFTTITDSNPTASLTVGYGGTMYGEPLYKIAWAGRLEIKVNGTDSPLILDSGGTYTDAHDITAGGGELLYYEYKCNQEEIYIDSSRKIAYKLENGVKKICCELTSGIYPFLDCGSNTFQFTLDKSVWDYNDRKYTRTGQKLTTFEVTKNERWL